jgi:hypothetical protein
MCIFSDYEYSDGTTTPTPQALELLPQVNPMNQSTGDYPSREVFAGPYGLTVEIDSGNSARTPKRTWEVINFLCIRKQHCL